MEEIEEYLKNGIVIQIFQAETNLLIWESIAKNFDKYDKQDIETKRLFSFIQLSAQTNFILFTSKIFDRPNKKYPTRCLLSFFDLIDKTTGFPNIENDTATINLLKRNNCPQSLIDAVNSKTPDVFAREFCKYYKAIYVSDRVKNDIEEIKFLRDKFIAHNEIIEAKFNLELQTVRNALRFATEVISIFGMAFFNSLWTLDERSLITESAERNAYFMQPTFKQMLKN